MKQFKQYSFDDSSKIHSIIQHKRSGDGTPSFDIPPAILEELRGLGFTWTRIAKMLNVSCSTIHRRVTDHGLEGVSQLSDNLIMLL